MPSARELLVQHLKSLQENGHESVVIDNDARLILRGWAQSARAGKVSKNSPVAGTSSAISQNFRETSEPDFSAEELRAETPIEQATPALIIPEKLEPQGATKAERIAWIREKASNWPPAQQLSSLRQTMVFATGNPETRIMFVGEAPGYHEERLQEPFVGPAGEKLNSILRAMELSREQIYISNIVKFRPAIQNQTTNNRKPTELEMTACMPLIAAEIEVIQPEMIIALGASAAEGLLQKTESLARLRGTFHSYQNIPVRVTYHPSYLLRVDDSPVEKRKVWEDMLAVMEMLGLPISEKQRGYFLPK